MVSSARVLNETGFDTTLSIVENLTESDFRKTWNELNALESFFPSPALVDVKIGMGVVIVLNSRSSGLGIVSWSKVLTSPLSRSKDLVSGYAINVVSTDFLFISRDFVLAGIIVFETVDDRESSGGK